MNSVRKFSNKNYFVALVILVALWLTIFPPSALTGDQAKILGIVLVTLSLWATGVVPGYLASLIFFAFTLILKLASPDLVFAGFGSTAVWLIISGFVIGSAVSISGWGNKLADAIGPLVTRNYAVLIGGLMAVCMALGFIMPSSVGRAVVMVPIGMALADRFGFAPGSNGRIGIASILAIGCNMPSFAILPSNIPNMILAGSAESIWDIHFNYTEYLVLHYPLLGIVKSALTVLLILKLSPAKLGSPLQVEVPGKLDDKKPRDRKAEIRVAIILLATLVFWMTDSLHGINSAWVGLVAAILLLMPHIGVVTPPAFKNSIDFGLILFVVGALALGAIVNNSGLGALIGELLQRVLPLAPGHDFLNFISLALMSMITGLFATVPGVPAVLTPMAQDLSQLTGFSLPTILMTQVFGFSTVLFPYQIGPLIVAMQLSGEKLSHLTKIILWLALLSVLLILPLDYLWWRLLGWI